MGKPELIQAAFQKLHRNSKKQEMSSYLEFTLHSYVHSYVHTTYDSIFRIGNFYVNSKEFIFHTRNVTLKIIICQFKDKHKKSAALIIRYTAG